MLSALTLFLALKRPPRHVSAKPRRDTPPFLHFVQAGGEMLSALTLALALALVLK